MLVKTSHRRGSLVALTVSACLSGCMASTLESLRHPPSAQEIRAAFVSSGQKLIHQLRQLRGSAPTAQAVDYQTAITLESLRLTPRFVADRRAFLREADKLRGMVASVPAPAVPRDSAALLYIASLARGETTALGTLSHAERAKIRELCGPGTTADTDPVEAGLRKSCFLWVLGDAPKSNAIYDSVAGESAAMRAQTPARTGDKYARAASPFDVFIMRLSREAGVDLYSHRQRLAAGSVTQPTT